jgi:hypothetical protein
VQARRGEQVAASVLRSFRGSFGGVDAKVRRHEWLVS